MVLQSICFNHSRRREARVATKQMHPLTSRVAANIMWQGRPKSREWCFECSKQAGMDVLPTRRHARRVMHVYIRFR